MLLYERTSNVEHDSGLIFENRPKNGHFRPFFVWQFWPILRLGFEHSFFYPSKCVPIVCTWRFFQMCPHSLHLAILNFNYHLNCVLFFSYNKFNLTMSSSISPVQDLCNTIMYHFYEEEWHWEEKKRAVQVYFTYILLVTHCNQHNFSSHLVHWYCHCATLLRRIFCHEWS